MILVIIEAPAVRALKRQKAYVDLLADFGKALGPHPRQLMVILEVSLASSRVYLGLFMRQFQSIRGAL